MAPWLTVAVSHHMPPCITGVAVRGSSIQLSAQKSDHIVQDLVLVDLVEDLMLRPRVDVLFDIASTQVLHRLRSRVEWSKDVLFAVNPQRRQIAEVGAGLDGPCSREDRLQRPAMEPSVVDELVGRIRLA